MSGPNVQSVDMRDPDAARNFATSIHETGFAILGNHPVDATLLHRINREWRAFFASDDKFNYQIERHPDGRQDGYFSLAVSERAVGQDVKDIKEFFHAAPDGPMPETLRADVIEYRSQALALGRLLLGWLQAALPAGCLNDPSVNLANVLDDEPSVLRILHYPPLSGDEPAGSVRAAAHEDINFITLLPVALEPGLQVKTLEGSWLDLHGESGEIIVNTGDMLQEMTDGYLPSTTHRVVNPSGSVGNISRISMPFFLAPELSLRLSQRYTAGEYLAERLTEIDGKRDTESDDS
ncbi:MAG: 2OG-Fe(II) oxygenase family protein [Pseudomonadota bacterium]